MLLEVTLGREATTAATKITFERSLVCMNTSFVDDKIRLALVRLSTTRFITSVFVHILMDLLMLFQVPRALE